MKNYRAPGASMTVVAPAGGCKSGDIVIVGKIFGVAGFDAAAGALVQIHNAGGIYQFPKKTGTAWVNGNDIFWDPANKWCHTVTSTGAIKIGVALGAPPAYTAAASGDAIGDVKLNPSF